MLTSIELCVQFVDSKNIYTNKMYTIIKINEQIKNCIKFYIITIKFDSYDEYTVLRIPLHKLSYDDLVSILINTQYSQDKMQAIINNYLLDGDTDDVVVKEFKEMQEWRKLSKVVAKDILSRIN